VTVKTIVDVEINDAQWKKFNAEFEKYREGLKKMPGAWGETEAKVSSITDGFLGMTAALLAQNKLMHKQTQEQNSLREAARGTHPIIRGIGRETKNISDNTAKSAKNFKSMAKDAKDISYSMLDTARSISKFALGAFAGLVGGAGITTFGLDRLAANSSNFRRAGLGVGASTGELRAFNNSYARFINPDAFLENINQISGDRRLQYGLGGNVARMSGMGMDTAQIAAQMLPQIVDQFVSRGGMGPNAASAMQSLGLDRFGLSLDDLRRLARSRTELSAAGSDFGKNATGLNTPDATGLAWQNFVTKLDLAGEKIETVFINRLVKLEPGLEKLTGVIADFVDHAMSNKEIGHWLDLIGQGLESAGKYLGGPDFSRDVKSFVDSISSLSGAAERLNYWFNGGPETPAVKQQTQTDTPDPKKGDWMDKHIWGPLNNAIGVHPEHNPLNLRGTSGGFRNFDTDAEGILAAKHQIDLDINKHGLKTLGDLIGDPTWGWAPKSDGNDPDAYLSTIKRETGLDRTTKLDSSNIDQLSAIIAAMNRVETPKSYHSPAEVKVIIQNQTGGSAVISGSQVAQ
jgi:hypothetical protein